MTLRTLQAGFRSLVAHPGAMPAARSAARRRILASTPGLTADDRDVLAAIPADRAAVYHDLIVGGHQSMLRYALGSTLALFDLVAAAHPRLAKNGGFMHVVEAFIAAGGPRTHSLRELATKFARFLRRRHAAAFARVPLLGAVMAFELAELNVELENDGPGVLVDAARSARLAYLTVGGLLNLRVLIPTHVRMLRARHSVHHAIHVLRATPPPNSLQEVVISGAEHLILARDPATLDVAWQVVDGAAWRALKAHGTGRAFKLRTLAEARLARAPQSESEDSAANRVLAELLAWLIGGVLALAHELK